MYRTVDLEFLGIDFDSLDVKREQEGMIENLRSEAIIGKEITEKGFMSTSMEYIPDLYIHGNVMLEISIPAGANGVFLEKDMTHYRADKEVLFDKGYKLEIIGASVDKAYNHIVIQAKMKLNDKSI